MAGHDRVTCTPSRRTGRRGPLTSVAPAVVALAVATALTFMGCPSGVDWSDYEGVNLIGARPFGATDDAGDALWYFADGLEAGTVDPVSGETAVTDYVVFEEVDSAVYGSLPTDAVGPVYRLETVNLLANGTFEDPAAYGGTGNENTPDNHDGVAGWEDATVTIPAPLNPVDATIVNASATSPRLPAFDGLGLSLVFADGGSRYVLDLTDPNSFADGFPAGALYAFAIEFQASVQSFGIEMNNNGDGGSVQSALTVSRTGETSEIYTFPSVGGENTDRSDATAGITGTNLISAESSFPYFSFSGIDSSVQGLVVAVIDNLRFLRADQNHYLRLPVTYIETLPPTRPILRSGGSYIVRMWVRDDPTAATASHPDRIKARFISAGIDPRYNSPTIPIVKTRSVNGTARTYIGDLDGWRQIEFSVSGDSIQTDTSMTGETIVFDLVIEIGESSAGVTFRDAGSVLITDVELEWSPNAL